MENAKAIDVSVIIPVYNAEKFLVQCLSSYAAQTLENIEVICVDDGSTDGSLAICGEFAAKDCRFKVFSQSNQGAATARNCGIGKACGKYLFFSDSDDYCKADMLEKMVAAAEQHGADVVVAGKYVDVETQDARYTRVEKLPKAFLLNPEGFVAETPEINIFKAGVVTWNKLFRRDFIIGNDIEFRPLPSCNDAYFVVRSLFEARKIVPVAGQFYHYRYAYSSTQITNSDSVSEIFLRAFAEIRDYLADKSLPAREAFFKFVITGYLKFLIRRKSNSAIEKMYAILRDGGIERLSYPDIDVENVDLGIYGEPYRLVRQKADIAAVLASCHNARYYDKENALLKLRKKHAKLEKEKVASLAELETVKGDCEKLRGQLKREKTANDKLQSDLGASKDENAKLAANLASVSASCDEFKAAYSGAKKKIGKLKAKTEQLEKKVALLESSFSYRIGRAITTPVRWVRSISPFS